MSYIFDALQRLDEKRSHADETARASVIELLERAERQVAAERNSELSAQEAAGTEILNGEPNNPSSRRIGVAPNSVDVHAEASKAKIREDLFGEFQTLSISCPESSRLVCCADQDIPGAEAFRLLAVRLRDLSRQRALRKLLITSTVPQEGKSMVSSNLACALGRGARQKVLLIEGDIRRPGMSQLFGLTDVSGLCDYLRGECTLSECVYYLDGPGVWILPAGRTASASLETIQSPQLPVMMQELNSWFDWIVIDSPPILPLADTSVWARLSDGILLVTRRGITKKKKLQKGLEALDSNKLIGALLNSSSSGVDPDYYYYYRKESDALNLSPSSSE